MKRKIWLCFYYGIARWLPASYKIGGRWAKKVRYECCKHIFKSIGRNVNIEHGAWFGDGHGIEIGDNSGIGINAHILNNTIIGRDVMMGANCYMLESLHIFDRTDISMLEQGGRMTRDQVIIGDDIWIAYNVTIPSFGIVKLFTDCLSVYDVPFPSSLVFHPLNPLFVGLFVNGLSISSK